MVYAIELIQENLQIFLIWTIGLTLASYLGYHTNEEVNCMNEKKLKSAISEAERFLSRAKELGKLLSEQEKKRIPGEIFNWDHFPKESGSVRRASMDLTRALSDLRRYD